MDTTATSTFRTTTLTPHETTITSQINTTKMITTDHRSIVDQSTAFTSYTTGSITNQLTF